MGRCDGVGRDLGSNGQWNKSWEFKGKLCWYFDALEWTSEERKNRRKTYCWLTLGEKDEGAILGLFISNGDSLWALMGAGDKGNGWCE